MERLHATHGSEQHGSDAGVDSGTHEGQRVTYNQVSDGVEILGVVSIIQGRERCFWRHNFHLQAHM